MIFTVTDIRSILSILSGSKLERAVTLVDVARVGRPRGRPSSAPVEALDLVVITLQAKDDPADAWSIAAMRNVVTT